MKIDDDLGALKKKLQELADILNSFKSEAVQLRVLELIFTGAQIDTETNNKTEKKTIKRRKRTKVIQDQEDADAVTKEKPKRSGSGKGVLAIVSALVKDGFFKSPQTIGNIIEYCGTQKGHHFKSNEISPALLRLIRNQTLSRKKNKDNQYEYFQG